LIEKAFTKLKGGYNSIDGGNPLEAGVNMLGTPGDWVDLLNTSITATKVWSDLTSFYKA
jgi:hypothetical protein